MQENKIDANEFMFMRALLIRQEDGDNSLFGEFCEVLYLSNIKLSTIIKSLQDKGIINKSYIIPSNPEEFKESIDEIPLNKNKVKKLYKCSFELGKELFEAYPQFGNINGNIVPLRTVARHYNSLEDAYFKYGKAIRFNPDIHKEIIELVKWANDNNILSCSLSSFIINHGWIDLQSLKDGKSANINYDAIRML